MPADLQHRRTPSAALCDVRRPRCSKTFDYQYTTDRLSPVPARGSMELFTGSFEKQYTNYRTIQASIKIFSFFLATSAWSALEIFIIIMRYINPHLHLHLHNYRAITDPIKLSQIGNCDQGLRFLYARGETQHVSVCTFGWPVGWRHCRVARCLSGRASDLRSKSRGFEARGRGAAAQQP